MDLAPQWLDVATDSFGCYRRLSCSPTHEGPGLRVETCRGGLRRSSSATTWVILRQPSASSTICYRSPVL